MSVSYGGDKITFDDGTSIASGLSHFRNRIINGAMEIDQRNAGASVTITTNHFITDRWNAGGSQSSKFTVQQNAGSVTPPSGFTNYLGCTSSSAYSVVSDDYFLLTQPIEGFNMADLGWGSANAKTITISFWVRSSLTGTFGGSLVNSAANRSYPFTYTINSANTWEQKSVTIAGDTSGTWLTTNGVGVYVRFGLGVGTTYSGTAGSWSGNYYLGATGATSVVGTNNATFFITGVQLEVGSFATTFERRPYGTELQLCQRYFYQSKDYGSSLSYTDGDFLVYGAYADSNNWMFAQTRFPVTMRASPTVTTSDSAGNIGKITIFTSNSGQTTNNITPYTVGATPNSYNISVYSQAKYGFYGAVSASAEY